jgi:hypothetical protein
VPFLHSHLTSAHSSPNNTALIISQFGFIVNIYYTFLGSFWNFFAPQNAPKSAKNTAAARLFAPAAVFCIYINLTLF